MNMGSRLFMSVGATFFLLAFALPLLLCPVAWARRIGWRIPDDRDLVNYLGRSLGGVILAIVLMAYLAAADPWEYRFMFDLSILVGLIMAGIHVYGFLRKNQPLVEHVEIVLYILLSILAWYTYPGPPA